MTKPEIGDEIIVKIGGNEYKTIIASDGRQRFVENSLLRHLIDSGMVSLNQLAIDYQAGKFPKEEYLFFYMGIGYSVGGFAELSVFEDLEIENPLWAD